MGLTSIRLCLTQMQNSAMSSQHLRIKPTHSLWASTLTRYTQKEGREMKICILRLYLHSNVFTKCNFPWGLTLAGRAKRSGHGVCCGEADFPLCASPLHSLTTFQSSQLQLCHLVPALYSSPEALLTLQAPIAISPGLPKCTSRTPLN